VRARMCVCVCARVLACACCVGARKSMYVCACKCMDTHMHHGTAHAETGRFGPRILSTLVLIVVHLSPLHL
jgi:hypothetical protein